MYMILCVIDQVDQLNAVLDAWRNNGIGGVTIVESTGLHRHIAKHHIPMRYSFGSTSAERGNITLLTVVETEEIVQRCLEITESITGDFDGPDTGIFVAWPVGFAKGVTRRLPE